MKQTWSLSKFTWCPKSPDFTLVLNFLEHQMCINSCAMLLYLSVFCCFQPKLVTLMGKDNFDLYAGKIWQLKFCEDMARIGLPS